MSLNFSAGATHKVNCGDVAAQRNLTDQTHLAWVYHNATPDNDAIDWKGLDGSGSRRLFFETSSNDFVFHVRRATTPGEVRATSTSAFAHYGTSKWLCWACRISATVDADCQLYCGDLSNPLAEATSYVGQTAGSGSHNSNTGQSMVLGNRINDDRQFDGLIALIAIWNRRLALAELRRQQFRPFPTSGCVGFYILGWPNGTGQQVDWSSAKAHGTVTGATLGASHVPIVNPFARV